MTPYADVSVIVEGALDQSEVFHTDQQVSAFVEEVQKAAETDGLETEVCILWHEHDLSEEDCACAQYVQDGRPDYSWNFKGEGL